MKMLTLLLVCGALAFAGGCNMVKGMAKDVHDGAQTVQEGFGGDSSQAYSSNNYR